MITFFVSQSIRSGGEVYNGNKIYNFPRVTKTDSNVLTKMTPLNRMSDFKLFFFFVANTG